MRLNHTTQKKRILFFCFFLFALNTEIFDLALNKTWANDMTDLDIRGRALPPSLPFEKQAGFLPSPVRGQPIVSFGQKFKSGEVSNGLAFIAQADENIVSPGDGWVKYIGSCKTFLTCVIVDAGQSYQILVAGEFKNHVRVGDFVLAAQPIGIVKKLSNNKQMIYLEMKRDGVFLDPAKWIKLEY